MRLFKNGKTDTFQTHIVSDISVQGKKIHPHREITVFKMLSLMFRYDGKLQFIVGHNFPTRRPSAGRMGIETLFVFLPGFPVLNRVIEVLRDCVVMPLLPSIYRPVVVPFNYPFI